MTTRERLRRLVDEVPEDEIRVAERFLEYLRDAHTPLYTPETAPFDDEPVTPEEEAAVAEALEELATGKAMSTAELLKMLNHEEG